VKIAQLSEATKIGSAGLTGKTWKIKIIEGDRQGSSAYYPAKALEEGAHLFTEGVRIFRNHPSANDKWDQPERKIEDIIGWLSEDATFEGKDLYANATFIESEQARIKELAEAGVIAMSIRASGEMQESANGMELKKFTAVHSVDVVTVAGAGGKFEKLVEAGTLDNSEAEALAESEKEEIELEISQEFIDLLEKQSKLTTDLLEKLDAKEVAEADAKQKALDEAAAAAEPKGPTAAEVAEALVEAALPAKARARVLALVEAGNDLTESIKAEKEIAAEYLAEAGKSGGAGHIDNDGANLTEAQRLSAAFDGVFSS
jgi:hypothetical protein